MFFFFHFFVILLKLKKKTQKIKNKVMFKFIFNMLYIEKLLITFISSKFEFEVKLIYRN
jgi:hypothetical protein